MTEFSNKDFIDFIDEFNEYLLPITEISKPKNSNQSLIYNKFKMFSFDDMCKKYPIMKKNTPKSMDALHYEIDENDKLTLYLIEFKTFSMINDKSTYTTLNALYNKLKKLNTKTIDSYSTQKIISDRFLKEFEIIKKHFRDSIESDLILKPLESIFVSLPWLYDEYVKNNTSAVKKDIRNYLNSIDIRLVIFINRYAPNTNISANRLSAHTIDNRLKSEYNRLYLSNVIADDNQRILSKDRFSYFIQKEKLKEITPLK